MKNNHLRAIEPLLRNCHESELERLRRRNAQLICRCRDLVNQVDTLRDGLRPFAREVEFWENARSNDLRPILREGAYGDACDVETAAFTVGDLRRARDLVEQASAPLADGAGRDLLEAL